MTYDVYVYTHPSQATHIMIIPQYYREIASHIIVVVVRLVKLQIFHANIT